LNHGLTCCVVSVCVLCCVCDIMCQLYDENGVLLLAVKSLFIIKVLTYNI
jgi:hypothetical protein